MASGQSERDAVERELDESRQGTCSSAATSRSALSARRTGAWLAEVDPAMRIKVIGFRPHGVRPHDPPLVAPTATGLAEAASVLGSVGTFDLTIV